MACTESAGDAGAGLLEPAGVACALGVAKVSARLSEAAHPQSAAASKPVQAMAP